MFVVSGPVILSLRVLLKVVHGTAPGLWMMAPVANISIAVTALMARLVQSRVARLLKGWLYGPRRSESPDRWRNSGVQDLWAISANRRRKRDIRNNLSPIWIWA